MWLKIDCKDFEIRFHISGFVPENAQLGDAWCIVDLIIDSWNHAVHYALRDDEALEYTDLKQLEDALNEALNGQPEKEILIEPLEPYMQFIVRPKDANGYGPVLDWRIYPWADSDNSESYWNIQLDAEKMTLLLSYLRLEHQEILLNDTGIIELQRLGVLFERFQSEDQNDVIQKTTGTETNLVDVSFSYGIGKSYTYISNLPDLHEGDVVLVPVGKNNEEKKAWIREIKKLQKNQNQFYSGNYKKIISLLHKATEYPETPPESVFCPVLHQNITAIDCLENRDTDFGKNEKPKDWQKTCERCLWYDY
ncbi:MAG: hypothetical protein SPL49_05435 [Oribacterium sp.]|nr:hypothetical protein [Oribacterium sp.]